MAIIENTIATGSAAYRANRDGMLALIAGMRALEDRTRAASAAAKDRFHKRGQLLPRERVAVVLDPGSPFLELSTLAGYMFDVPNVEKSVPGGGLIAGIGFVSGIRCMVSANDAGIDAGALQPFGRNITFTAILAIISFVVILASSNKHYWGHILNPPGVPGWVKVILVPVELLGVLTKPFALMIRLFANMVAGHILNICLISLIFIMAALNQYVGWGFSPFSIAFTIFIYFIEVLVAFLQAFIFTILTGVFIGQAIEGAHEDHAHAAAH